MCVYALPAVKYPEDYTELAKDLAHMQEIDS